MGEKEKRAGSGKKWGLLIMAAVIIVLAGALAVVSGLNGAQSVEFKELSKNKIPQDIIRRVIPEYRTLERALACVVEDKVYVIVTRGEKPTSGFHLSIDRMELEEKNGKSNLIVYADFEDPDEKTSLSHVVTYPIQVAVTDLKKLPDEIELRIQYD